MLHLTSWMTTLPMMLIGMVGIILVIGIIVLAVMLLNRLTGRLSSITARTMMPMTRMMPTIPISIIGSVVIHEVR